MKRILSCLMVLAMLLTLAPGSVWAADVTASGTCGENLTWTLDSAGTLTISGTGDMEFGYNGCPWYDYTYQIRSAVLENGVTGIAEDAFYRCERMNTVTIPDSVTSIGNSAFRECSSLTGVSISKNVTSIGNYAFQFCTGLSRIIVAQDNPNYSSDTIGALYNKDKTELIRVPGAFYGTFVVPDTVTTIVPNAFQNCDYLSGVELSDSMTSIGFSAFLFCRNLKKITIPASVIFIDEYAFSSCWNLTEITFEGNAPSIASNTFEGATATAYYPAGNATWTEEAMQNYGGTLTWEPYTVTVASGTCGENLTWTLDSAGTLTISGTGPMGDYSYDYFQGSSIPWYEHMASINKVVIEDGVTTIGNYAFYECGSLTSVSIPESVTSIGRVAFADCRSLTSIALPNSVRDIGEGAFNSCTSLTGITIPDGMKEIKKQTFFGCNALTSVTIPGSVTTIGSSAFGLCHGLTSVVIPEGVTTIGDTAFQECTGLTSVTFPSTLTYIGSAAFAYCCELPSVAIPASVTTIEDHAFSYCNILEGIWVEEGNEFFSSDDRGVLFNKDQTVLLVAPDGMHGEYAIPDSVKTIGYYAFYRCNNLTSITIPDSVTAIDREAFGCCEGLTSITIPESVTSIGESAFYWCAINEITFEGDAPSIAERAFSRVTATAYYPAGNTTWTEEVMQDYGGPITWKPYAVTVASGTCGENLTWTLDSAGTLTISGTGAMDNYDSWFNTTPWENHKKSIKNIVIEDGVTTIGDSAFFLCRNLTSVSIPNSVTTVGMLAFSQCSALTGITVPNSVTTICKWAFSGCWSLTGITIPESVTSIDGNTFQSCMGLNGIWVDQNNEFYSSDDFGVLFDKEKTTLIAAPGGMSGEYVIPNSVTTIGDDSFNSCVNLTGIAIPDTVTSIGVSPFGGCNNLVGFYVDQNNQSYSSDDRGVLFNKDKTTLIAAPGGISGVYTIPSGVTTIAVEAFGSCGSLEGVIISESVTDIGNSAFMYCSSLTNITIPDSVTTIGDSAFFDCSGLNEIKFEGDAPSAGFGVFYGVTATAYYPSGNTTWTEEVMQDYGDTLTWTSYIPLVASGTCGENLTWTLDKNMLLTISGTGAMGNYSWDVPAPWSDYTESIEKVIIEEGVTTIGDHAFTGCVSLTSVAIPECVVSIGVLAFSRCGCLTDISIPNSVTTICDDAFYGCGSLTGITIPESVTSIAGNPFQSCMGLNGIWVDQNNEFYSSDDFGVLFNKDKTTLIAAPGGISGTYAVPNGVTTIGAGGFHFCVSLTGITIPESVTSIGRLAFCMCSSLTSITIPESVTSIGSFAFYVCSSLTSIILPERVTSIGEDAFSGCSSLTSITIPESVTSIGASTFSGCSSLTSITIPEGMTSIDDSMFWGCSSLTSVTIPENVTSIGSCVFWECSSLTSITIPENVTSIGFLAFCGCSSLTEVIFAGNAPSFDSEAFCYVTATAYYPAGNTTWTEEVMQDYSGTITWVPIGEEIAVPTLMLKYPTLSFESEINYNVYFTVADAEVAVEDLGLITWYTRPASTAAATYESAEYVIPGAVYNSAAGEYMVKTQGIPAAQMGDDLYLRVYAKLSDGTYAYSAVTYYSARDYAHTILATSSNDAMKGLCVALLNYGAAAQQHFGHNTDNLMNAGLTDAQQALAEKWTEDMMRDVITPDSAKTVNFVSNGGFSKGYPSVSFEGDFAINYFFTAKQTPDADILLYCWDEETYLAEDVLTEENAVRVLTMKGTSNISQYMAAYSGIPAKDIGKTLFVAAVYQTGDVRYSSPVVAYSLGAYCQDRIENGSDTMKTLARETAVYGWYADNYFSK